jgi:hypothetical protein
MVQHVLNDFLKSSCFVSVNILLFFQVSIGLLNFVTETQQQQNIIHTTTTLSQARE